MAKIDFEQAYDEHAWWVLGYMANRVARADAEELTQSVFERAFISWGRFDPARGTIGAWLFTIARNILTDHLRAAAVPHRRTVPLEEEHPQHLSVPGPEDALGLDPLLADALRSISERDREIVALRFGGELTGPQIATITGLSLANVQQIISRSLRRMREHLDDARRESAALGAQNASGPAPASPSAARASSSRPHSA